MVLFFCTASYVNFLGAVIDGSEENNSAAETIKRTVGFHIYKSVNVTGTGSQSANVLQVTGTVIILDQYAEIKTVTTLTNLTGLYSTLYDGTNTVDLTSDGAILSGMPVGTFFTKDKVSTEVYSINDASQCRVLETLADRKSGRPFTITQKNGANTYIQLHYTTTDNPVDFDVEIHFEYLPVNGGTLTFL